jgi:D-arginine dehydrogenase
MNGTARTADVVVIGAGIAGLSAGAELARDRRVVVLEAERAPAQHTTGRSAAVWIEAYGGPRIRPFNRASRAWYDAAGEGLADGPLTRERGMLVVAAPGDDSDLSKHEETGSRLVGPEEAVERFPALRPEAVGRALYAPTVCDLDAAGAVTAYRRALRERGGELVVSARVTGLERRDGAWRVASAAGEWRAAVVVDAAGAWADDVARMAGLPPIGLVPMRRTICTFRAPDGVDPAGWPLLGDAADRFYVKPEPGHFLASPADETPSPPGDPRPEMEDVATALERVREATTLEARSILTSWAGLRTFAPDRCLVLGPDPLERSFVWCAGQGGFGIQSGPGAARALTSLVDGRGLPEDIARDGGDAAAVLPDRLRAGEARA